MIDWIRVSNDLPSNPKTHRLSRILKHPEAGWYVLKLFCWCSLYAQDGVIHGPDIEAEVEDAAGWTGGPGAFARAALAVGFLDKQPDGSVLVHNWMDWNGEAIQKAEKKAEYVRDLRKQQREERVKPDRVRTGSEPT